MPAVRPRASTPSSRRSTPPGQATTVLICPGTYVEGTGLQGTNALTISKDLTLIGAGGDQVTVEPRKSPASGGQIATANPDIRAGKGDILAAVGRVQNCRSRYAFPGLPLNGDRFYVTARRRIRRRPGASLDRSEVTGVEPQRVRRRVQHSRRLPRQPLSATASRTSPGLRKTAAPPGGRAAVRTLTIDHTRVDHYNAVGVLVDGATGDYSQYAAPPAALVPSRLPEPGRADRRPDHRPRNLCRNYNQRRRPAARPSSTATARPPAARPRSRRRSPLTTGPLFGQDGVRVTAGAAVQMAGDTVSSNLVNGTGSPVQSVFAPTAEQRPVPARQQRNQQPEPAARRRRPARRGGRLLDHRQQHHRQRVRRHQHHAGRGDRRQRDAARRPERLVGPADRRRHAAHAGPGRYSLPRRIGTPYHRDHLRPAGAGEPGGRRRPGDEQGRQLPGGSVGLRRRDFLPRTGTATRRTRPRATTRSATPPAWPPHRRPPARRRARTARPRSSRTSPARRTASSARRSAAGRPATACPAPPRRPRPTTQAGCPTCRRSSPRSTATVDRRVAAPGSCMKAPACWALRASTRGVIGTPSNIANLNSGRDDQKFWTGVQDGACAGSGAGAGELQGRSLPWITSTPRQGQRAGR